MMAACSWDGLSEKARIGLSDANTSIFHAISRLSAAMWLTVCIGDLPCNCSIANFNTLDEMPWNLYLHLLQYNMKCALVTHI